MKSGGLPVWNWRLWLRGSGRLGELLLNQTLERAFRLVAVQEYAIDKESWSAIHAGALSILYVLLNLGLELFLQAWMATIRKIRPTSTMPASRKSPKVGYLSRHRMGRASSRSKIATRVRNRLTRLTTPFPAAKSEDLELVIGLFSTARLASEHWDCTADNVVISVSYDEKKLNGKDPFADLETLSREDFFDKGQSRRLRIDGHAAVLSTVLMDDVTQEKVTVNNYITRRLLLVERGSSGCYRVTITSCDEASNRMAESFLKHFHVVNKKAANDKNIAH